jgi:hypothetical protein
MRAWSAPRDIRSAAAAKVSAVVLEYKNRPVSNEMAANRQVAMSADIASPETANHWYNISPVLDS